ncbi:cc592241-b443-4a60-97ec-4093a8eb1adb [Sclerotinia trifoliorum]|uniref:Cc592241-b443-4a60-97ec-4093a8eb1adb n=1 Tax=Sclerotinia trifoliorum TaxID=28548 RepID=A0A8H2W1L5_9HELO|nr:cc592241-b443-4a60-97ec-4093a8eb1adb [Sclerotinia trifoliorum]
MPPPPKKKPGKVRIPDHLRKRALVSCDRCKQRRIRCSRVGEEPCLNCVEANVNCECTLPRKTRIYGSIESLTTRYRVLDALIKGLFPQKDTNDIDVLYEIAAAHDITLPDFTADSPGRHINDVFAQFPKALASSPTYSDPSQRTMKDEPSPTEKSVTLPSSPQEALVPTPSGGESHFVGPSSSFGFALSCRMLVKPYADNLRIAQPNHSNLQLMMDFANSRWSKALEPKAAEERQTAPGPADLERAAHLSGNYHVPPIVPGKDPSEKEPLCSLLPSREIADVLIRSFFDRVHPTFMIFHRHSFEQRYDTMWSQLNVQVQDFESGWLCSVLMVLVLGAQALEPHDDLYIDYTQNYKSWVQSRASQLQVSSTLVNIQALLLLHLYLHNISERNLASIMLRAASTMATILGMHREEGNNRNSIESELRRRIWWTIYVLEQNACTTLGRPCFIDDNEVCVGFPNEDLLDGGACVPMNYVEELVHLTKLMAETNRMIYPPRSMPTPYTDKQMINNANRLIMDLETWHHRLPLHLRLDSQTQSVTHMRAIYLLHLQFHHTQSLVARPFIIRKVAAQLGRKLGKQTRCSNIINDEEVKLGSKCCLYSKQSILLVHQLITSGQFNGITWMDSYYVYHSVMVISLDFLGKDEPYSNEDMSLKKAVFDIKNAMDNIRLCPLFAMLTQVAFQLAQIGDLIDNHTSNAQPQQIDSRHLQSNVQAASGIDFSLEDSRQQTDMGDIIEYILKGNHMHIPWKIGPDGFAPTPEVLAEPMMDQYMNSIIPVMDEHTVATTMQGQIQPQQTYVNWQTGGYGVLSAHAQYGNPTPSPTHVSVNGNGHVQAQYAAQTVPSLLHANTNIHTHTHTHPYPQYGNQTTNPSRVNTLNVNTLAQNQYANPTQQGLSLTNAGAHGLNYDIQRNG